jgi:hypothetical protein
MFYEHISRQAETYFKLRALQRILIIMSCFNLFILALIGLTLRAYPFFSFPFQYRNLLHAHSHFAFGGWVMPVLAWLITKNFPSSANIKFVHWRNIVFLILFSAYGMLGSFPFQGYAPTSIFFSTLSTIAAFYLAIILWKVTRPEKNNLPEKFLRAGLFYLVLSSIGPFSTGPLIAMGKQGTNIYFDAIYFYLHFQYNGWFTFAMLAVLYKIMGDRANEKNGNRVFNLMNLACVPAFFLSVLWHKPGFIFNIIGGLAALMQFVAVYYFWKDAVQVKWKDAFVSGLVKISLAAFAMKIVLQVLSAIPSIAAMAYTERNFVISYLHLVLLGFISLGAFGFILNTVPCTIRWRNPLRLFIAGFILTEIILVIQAVCSTQNLLFPGFHQWIFICTILLPSGAGWIAHRSFSVYYRRRLEFKAV